MILKTKVKVGNITNLSDARYCAGMGVDLLGFPIGNNKDQISIETFQEIVDWVAGPEFVAEYSDAMDEQIIEKVTQMASIQHIQVNLQQLKSLSPNLTGKSIILSCSINDWFEHVEELKGSPLSYLVLLGDTHDWEKVKLMNDEVPVLAPYSSLTMKLEELLTLPLSGIVLEGTSEDKPGQKDYDHLAEVLESLEID